MEKILKIRKKFNVICLVMLFTMFAGSFIQTAAAGEIPTERLLPRLVDSADVLSDSEEASLLAKLDEVSERHNLDVAIHTMSGESYSSLMQYADDFFDYNGFGTETAGGIMLVMDYSERDWWITTYALGIDVLTDKGREYMADVFVPYLSDGKNYEGFMKYAELCDEYAREYKETGEAYSSSNLPEWKKSENLVTRLIIAAVFAVVVAFIAVAVMTSQLKTVRAVFNADKYVEASSFYLDEVKDSYLYRTVSKTKREKESGSSTHGSSSGRSHGGGGGSF